MQSNGLKQRLVGALVLASIAAIFIPMILDGPDPRDEVISETNIPPRPDEHFISKVIPINGEPGKREEAGGDTQQPVEAAAGDEASVGKPLVAGAKAVPVVKPASASVQKPAPKAAKPEAKSKTAVKSALKPASQAQPKPGPVAKHKAPDKKAATETAGKVAPKSSPKTGAPLKPARDIHAWAVQVGSFSTLDNAERLRDQLRAQGFRAFVDVARTSKGETYRVRVGPELDRKRAKAVREELRKKMKLKGIVLRHG